MRRRRGRREEDGRGGRGRRKEEGRGRRGRREEEGRGGRGRREEEGRGGRGREEEDNDKRRKEEEKCGEGGRGGRKRVEEGEGGKRRRITTKMTSSTVTMMRKTNPRLNCFSASLPTTRPEVQKFEIELLFCISSYNTSRFRSSIQSSLLMRPRPRMESSELPEVGVFNDDISRGGEFYLISKPTTRLITADAARYLWKPGELQGGGFISKCAWSKVTSSKAEGGLGIVDPATQNVALLGKWLQKAVTQVERRAWIVMLEYILQREFALARAEDLWHCVFMASFSRRQPPSILDAACWTAWRALQPQVMKEPVTREEVLRQPLFDNPAILNPQGHQFAATASPGDFGRRWVELGVTTIADIWQEDTKSWTTAEQLQGKLRHLPRTRDRLQQLHSAIPAQWQSLLRSSDPVEGEWYLDSQVPGRETVFRIMDLLDKDVWLAQEWEWVSRRNVGAMAVLDTTSLLPVRDSELAMSMTMLCGVIFHNLSMLSTLAAGVEDRMRGRRRLWVLERSGGVWEDLQREGERHEEVFRRFCRLPRPVFNDILQRIGPHIQRATTNWRQPLPTEQKFACALIRWATGGSYRQSGHGLGMGLASALRNNKDVAGAMIREYGHVLSFPEGRRLREVMDAFERKGFPGCVGAVDCTHLYIEKPRNEHAACYYDRTGQFSIIAQVVCDHECRILDVFVGCPGSCHDIRVLKHFDSHHRLRQRGGCSARRASNASRREQH
ncbi:hypothetical protein CBR_g32622 [Chara braunii]|uniref:DDE Tnp4 domain-containing protein n=1 Tax=Chara braunii TaxID=69332 RepID=A0A388LH33_CHABU|nr:hypothetical protein CBR_g32622 [Chara braunii]|eukprot:GBG81629.1 hypothetical protein CBR_g32622 [Chara braunii]